MRASDAEALTRILLPGLPLGFPALPFREQGYNVRVNGVLPTKSLGQFRLLAGVFVHCRPSALIAPDEA